MRRRIAEGKMRSRGDFLRDLVGAGSALLLFLTPGLQGVGSDPISEEPALSSGDRACDEKDLKAVSSPFFKDGQVFEFRSTRVEDGSSAAAGREMEPGKVVLHRELFPLSQTIRTGGLIDYQGRKCRVLERTAIIESPLATGGAKGPQKTAEEKTTAYIGPDGRIRYSRAEMSVTDEGSQSVSTNEMTDLALSSEIHYFYGYWMLALGPKFQWECVSERDGKPMRRTIAVKGMEKIGGRDCFVVVKTVQTEGGSESVMFWVDAATRTAVQTRFGGWLMKRVS